MAEQGKDKKELISHVHKPVTSGKIVEKSKLQKAAAIFFAEDLDNIKGSIVDDYIRPRSKEYAKDSVRKFKKFLFDNVMGALEIIFFGKSQGAEKRGYYNGEPVSYYSYYDGRYSSSGGSSGVPALRKDPESHLKIIEIPDYGKAQKVIGDMIAISKRYTAVTVADYYQLVDIVPTDIDFQWGWQGFIGADVIDAKHGYIIDLPRPVPID